MFDPNNLQIHSNVKAADLENAVNKLKPDNGLKGLGESFIKAEKAYNINAVILMAIACLESGYGLSALAKEKNNLFGLDAPLGGEANAKYFNSKQECVDHAGHRLGKQYLELDPTCPWRYVGTKDIYAVGKKWCEVGGWADKVLSVANRLKQHIPVAPPTTTQKWSVCVGTYSNKDNANRALQEAKDKGYTDAFLLAR